MRSIKSGIFAITALTALAAAGVAQQTGNTARGKTIAVAVCAQCHAVRVDQSRSPNPLAPGFVSVANWPGMTDRALRAWLQSSHPTMPNFVLKRDDRDDVVMYILSLRRGTSAL